MRYELKRKITQHILLDAGIVVVSIVGLVLTEGANIACAFLCLMAAGFLVLAAAWLVRLIFNPSAGALVFALAGTLLFFLKDSGRGFSLLLSYAANRFTGEPAVTALNRADSRLTELLKNSLAGL